MLDNTVPDGASALEFRAVARRFGRPGRGSGAVTAITDVTFGVARGEFVAVIGPSGCGKSTLLNLTAGLDLPSEGDVFLEGVRVAGPNPQVGFMLQKDLLLPWRSIRQNVEFGLEARAVSRAERAARAMRELRRCKLEGFADHYPHQLSGGMRQRAALARTLAIDPAIVLLDEPFSALDAQTKLVLQNSFTQTITASGITTLLITHDLAEAVMMADRILVMSERPGSIFDQIVVDLPARDDPMARRAHPRNGEYMAYLFDRLHLADQAA